MSFGGRCQMLDVRSKMSQDERESHVSRNYHLHRNKSNPSRHRIEEHLMLNCHKQNRKLLNARKLKEEGVAKFENLLELAGVCDTIKKIIKIIKIKRGNR